MPVVLDLTRWLVLLVHLLLLQPFEVGSGRRLGRDISGSVTSRLRDLSLFRKELVHVDALGLLAAVFGCAGEMLDHGGWFDWNY